MADDSNFKFRFSLATLNHLGRGLYRSFATVIAEAISNAWDADAECVNVKVEDDTLTIWDDGIGMSREDIQQKFLKIGYTRRSNGVFHSERKHRHIIGRKGIGKLAYLSISGEIIIITKKKGEKAISVKINNEELDKAIDQNKDDQEYPLVSNVADLKYSQISESGTQLIFKGLRKNLRKKNIRTILATQFHFTHALGKKDKFKILVNDALIGIKDMKALYDKTEFIWFFNEQSEKEFMEEAKGIKENFLKKRILEDVFKFDKKEIKIRGYIASVKKPRDLLVAGSDERFKASIALFAGGRIRESEIIAKITKAQIPENYLFGKIHIDEMDSEDVDRFTSSRDSILEDDPLYLKFLDFMRGVIKKIVKDWDKWRVDRGEDGDPDNLSIPPVDRKIDELLARWFEFNTSVPKKHRLIQEIKKLAHTNIPSYMQCFTAENLMRIYIGEKGIVNTDEDIKKKINGYKEDEEKGKEIGNIYFTVRAKLPGEKDNDLSYLGSLTMAVAIDKETKKEDQPNSLKRDVEAQKPIRNALMHTSTLSQEAKNLSDNSWNNIITKIIKLLDG